MKKLVSLIGVAAVALAAVLIIPTTSSAQVPTWSADVVSLPTIPANTTSNLASPALINAYHQQNIALEFLPYVITNSNIPGTNGYTNYKLAPTADLLYPDTNLSFYISVKMAASGSAGGITNNAIFTTNIDTYGYAGFYVLQISNNETNDGTVATKLIAPTKMSAP